MSPASASVAANAAPTAAVAAVFSATDRLVSGLPVNTGLASSSAIVSVTSAGPATAVPLTAPDTVTAASAASTSLSTAVMVTVPVLAVAFAAMVSTLFALRLKAPSSAGATADADTVTTVAEETALDSVAFTVVALSVPLSWMVDDPSSSVTFGRGSLTAFADSAAALLPEPCPSV